MATINSNIEAEYLKAIFSKKQSSEIVIWKEDTEAVGISIIKEYTHSEPFIPAKNARGLNDSAAMVRVWYLKKNVYETNGLKKVPLYVEILKYSKFNSNHVFPDFENIDSPTKSSLEISNSSRQPVDLEDLSDFELNLHSGKIFNLRKKVFVNAYDIVNEIYNKHIKLIKNFPFQLKIMLKNRIIRVIDPINETLIKINKLFFGKIINESKDFAEGLIFPYKMNDLIDMTSDPRKAKIFNVDLPISYRAATTFICFFSITYIFNYTLNYDFFGIIGLINNISSNFYLAVVSAFFVILFDWGIPLTIFFTVNILIRFKWFLINFKIKT